MPVPRSKNYSTERALNLFSSVLGGYAISYRDSSNPAYFMFVDRNSDWYVMQETTVGAVVTTVWCKGHGTIAATWAGRAGLSYDTFDVIFG
jgi:hypothetical protein